MKKQSPSRLLAFALLPWLIALAVPEIRTQFELQVDNFLALGSPDYFNVVVNRNVAWPSLHHASVEQAASEHPNDVSLAFVAAEMTALSADQPPTSIPRTVDLGLLRAHACEEVYKRFPQQSWLLASRIRTTMTQTRDDRAAGALEDINFPPLTSPPLKSKTAHALPAVELNRCIEIARVGRNLEPQNSFYDWWLAYFLFAVYRDDEAVAVLHEAAQKPTYDSHLREEIAARVHAHSVTQLHTAESKSLQIASQLLPHYAAMHHFGRLLAWRSHEAKAGGRHREALQLTADVTRFASRMRDQAYLEFDSQVACSLSDVSWKGVTRDFTPSEDFAFTHAIDSADAKTRLGGTLLIAYALQNGDGATASLVQREIAKICGDRAAFRNWRAQHNEVMGLRRDLEQPGMALWFGCQIVLGQAAVLAAVSLAMLGSAWPLGLEKWPGHIRDSNRAVLLCWVLLAFIVVTMYFGGAGWRDYFSDDGMSTDGAELALLAIIVGVFVPLVLCFLAAPIDVRWRRKRFERDAKGAVQVSRAASPVPCRATAAWNNLKQQVRTLKMMSASDGSPQANQTIDGRAPVMLSGKRFAGITLLLTLWILGVAIVITTLLAIMMPATLTFGTMVPWQDDLWNSVLVAAPAWVLLWLIHGSRWRVFTTTMAEAVAIFRRVRSSLLTYLLITGWVYLALSFLNLGFRREANAEVDRYILRGEKATMLASPDIEKGEQLHPPSEVPQESEHSLL